MTTLHKEDVASVIEVPWEDWNDRCHEISLAIVRAGLCGPSARVARGGSPLLTSQHSWIAASGDCYGEDEPIVDPTLWCHADDLDDIWHGTLSDRLHTPHGAGSIWEWGRPAAGDGPVVVLDAEALSGAARRFLDLLGPLDRVGWMALANAPVGGWPAGEILGAMDAHPDLCGLVPIDCLGMTTDLNPSGLYR